MNASFIRFGLVPTPFGLFRNTEPRAATLAGTAICWGKRGLSGFYLEPRIISKNCQKNEVYPVSHVHK